MKKIRIYNVIMMCVFLMISCATDRESTFREEPDIKITKCFLTDDTPTSIKFVIGDTIASYYEVWRLTPDMKVDINSVFECEDVIRRTVEFMYPEIYDKYVRKEGEITFTTDDGLDSLIFKMTPVDAALVITEGWKCEVILIELVKQTYPDMWRDYQEQRLQSLIEKENTEDVR